MQLEQLITLYQSQDKTKNDNDSAAQTLIAEFEKTLFKNAKTDKKENENVVKLDVGRL